MKKQIALLFSIVALVAFVSTAYAQSPKVDAKTAKVEKVAETKTSATCTDAKVKTDCAGKESEKADCKSAAAKTCGGCSSKAAAKPAETAPVPKK